MKDQTAASAKRKPYDSDLADAQWSVIDPLLPPTSRRSRPRKTDMREVVNALVCALRSGCARRMTPHDLPPRQTVYAYFRTWKSDGTLTRVHDAPPRRSPPGRRAKPRARRGGHGQPERANHGIGGIAGMTRAKM